MLYPIKHYIVFHDVLLYLNEDHRIPAHIVISQQTLSYSARIFISKQVLDRIPAHFISQQHCRITVHIVISRQALHCIPALFIISQQHYRIPARIIIYLQAL